MLVASFEAPESFGESVAMSKILAPSCCALVAVLTLGCPRGESGGAESGSPAVEDASARGDAASETSDRAGSVESDAGSKGRRKLCSVVTSEAVGGVTGKTYDSVTSQADFPNISHCEYRNTEAVAESVSLLIASGDAAVSRWESAQLFDPRPMAGFLDKASWEPAQGMLSAVSGDRFVEIRVSKAHGDEASRIELSQELAELMLERL